MDGSLRSGGGATGQQQFSVSHAFSPAPGSCGYSRPGEVGHGDERRRTAGPQAKLTSTRTVLAGSVRALLIRASPVLHVDARKFDLRSRSAQPTPPPRG